MLKQFFSLVLISTFSLFFINTTLAQQSSDNPFKAASSWFSDEPQFLPVEQAFQFNFTQHNDKITVNWQIHDGYYLYQHRFKVTSDTATIAQFELPSGTDHDDPYFGKQVVYYDEVGFEFSLSPTDQPHEITVSYQGCADAGLCYAPTKKIVYFDPKFLTTATIGTIAATTLASQSDAAAGSVPMSEQGELAGLLSGSSLGLTLLLFFGLGIGLAFTPCVFPMYPILSGIIVGSGNKLSTRQAFLLSFVYVQGMALTYSTLGLVVASAGLQFQAAFQHPIVLGTLAVLFTGLALSMFGVFNLQLPSSWQNKLNNMSNQQKGGRFTGVFVMGMISGLVASPCTTAPLSGALLYVAQTGDLLLGGVTLYVLSLGMGVPLLLMGTSGGKLLPKAGAWMEVIKGIFGFMLLSVVVVLLSRFISETMIQVIWGVLAMLFAGYLLHHNKQTKISAMQSVRHTLALVILIFGTIAVAAPWLGINHQNQPASNSEHQIKFVKIKGIQQLQQQLAQAKADGIPVMLDFYADWCVACKDFETQTFSDPTVKPILSKMLLLQADVTANDDLDIELQDHLAVLGLPSIILYNTQGEELKHLRVVGFQPPEQFKAIIEQAFN
ncbi:MAG: protein-disulfide reductase DsbD [Gammaproteobacteria bacterium]|nr:protein-disulfide reductase DsbD [Gammaproteobacteria bacterium]